MGRTRYARMLWVVGVGLLACLPSGCKTTPPAPPPPPVQAPPVSEVSPAAAQRYVRVTVAKLNVREKPTTQAATVGRVRKGERLAVLGADGEWLKVTLQNGKTGWIHGSYARDDQPCPADKPGAELLSDVPLSFSEGPAIGKVVVEVSVDAAGNVASTRLVQDTTGIPELVQRVESEARKFKFAPPVHNCHPVPFVYTYTRNF